MGSKVSDELLAALTDRERQVFELVQRGCSNAEIGKVLGISSSTAKNHVAAVLRKLQVSNRTEAAGLTALGREEAEVRRPVIAHPDDTEPPAVAVMPLRCTADEGVIRPLADGIVDDLITRLSRRWYPVIARCSTFSLPPTEGLGAREIGSQLGARYLVDGALSQLGSRIRLNVSLVDVLRGHVLWSESYDRPVAGIFELLDELSHAVMEGVFAATVSHVGRAIAAQPHAQLEPWQVGVSGMWHYWQGSATQNRRARTLFADALQREPEQRLSLYGTALTHQREIYEHWSPDPDASVDALEAAAGRFLGYWPDDAWALLVSAYTQLYRGKRDDAIASVERVLEHEPSSLGGRSLHGQLLAMDGQADLAVGELKKALVLSPRGPDRWVQECVLALAHFAGEQYEQAVQWGTTAARSSRAGAMAYGVLASSYFHLGEHDSARDASQRFQQLAPGFTSTRFKPMIASTRPEISARYLEGLAGAAAC